MRNSKPGLLYLFFFIGMTHAMAQSFPVDSVQSNGARNKRINLVFVSDGYQPAELNTFVTNVTAINTALMATIPFSEYKTFFNTYLIKVPSTNSGARHPGNAADESSSGSQPIANPSTYFSTTFDYGSIHRLIVPPSNTPVFNVLGANLPQYTQGFVLVNSPWYGGSGGTFATSTTHSAAAEIAIHEIGHSLAGLADEYWAGDGYAGEKANMTKTSSPATVKWKNWVGIKNVGVYQYGTSGNSATWYRPHQSCKMQYLGSPFCAVCSEAFVSKFHSLVNMINNYAPTSTSFTLTDTSNRVFTVNNLQTTSNTISVKWYLNGSSTPFATGSTVSIPYSRFATGSNTIKATVFDSTTLSKSYLPAIGYSNSITWSVSKPSPFARLSSVNGEIINENRALKNPFSSNNFKVYQDAAARKYSFNYGSDNNANVSISVSNAAGVRILQRKLGKSSRNQRYEFDLAGQPAGIYFFTILIGEEVYSAKLLAL